MYDPALGRFTSVDPLAEKYYPLTSYAYCHNSPIFLIDPFGTADGKPNKILWRQVGEGAASFVGGLSSMAVCYYAAANQPALGGASLMSLGTAGLGTSAIGLAQMISGFAGEELNLPNTMTGVYGRAMDGIANCDEPVFDNIGDLVEGGAGMRAPRLESLKGLQFISNISSVQTLLSAGYELLSRALTFDRTYVEDTDRVTEQ